MKIEKNTKYRLLLLLLCMIFSSLVSYFTLITSSKTYYWVANTAKYSIEGSDKVFDIDFDDSEWSSFSFNQIPNNQTNYWLRIKFELSDLNHLNPPYALFLSGLFSAEVYLNGQKIYDKGLINHSKQLVTAGKIDSAIYLPEHDLIAGTHLIAMKISTSKLGYIAENVFHLVAIGKYDSDERRELRYYALPLILSSGFLLLFLQFIKIARSSGTPYLIFLSLACIFALSQLVFEVSRSFISYPYNYHFYRSLLIWGINYLSICSLMLWFSYRIKSQSLSILIYLTMVINLIVSYFIVGFDEKTVTQIQITSLVLIIGVIFQLKSKDLLLYSIAILACFWLVIGLIVPSMLLDGIFYSCYIVFLGFTWWWISTGKLSSDTQNNESQQCTDITIKDTGRTLKIPIKNILFIKAEGNFAELNCIDESQYLHHLRLGQIMEKGPKNFLRIHRSYAINLQYLNAIKSKEGSRYYAEVNNHLIPVSRYKIADLRRDFEGT